MKTTVLYPLDGVECSFIIDEGETRGDLMFTGFFLELADNVVDGGES